MIDLHYWPTPNGHTCCSGCTATQRAYALATTVDPDAGQPMSDAERRILFGQDAPR